ncbi:MAG: hypothetical protein KF816_17365 [Melioribacteraceae bacterium]|nr:hypothetical protein [Melioribacteraceae bacterium]
MADKKKFESDPFGYSSLAWYKWGNVQTFAGFPVDISKFPTSEDLKSPILWLTHAEALTQAAISVIDREPNFSSLPVITWEICHSQYFAVALMLVGYSLEVCLKGMIIEKNGINVYSENEKDYKIHQLDELSDFIPNLNNRDNVILKLLTHYVNWAGRYPDPGKGRESRVEEIFKLSENYEITSKDLFGLASKVMSHAKEVFK